MEPHHHPASLPPPVEPDHPRFPPAHIFHGLPIAEQHDQLRYLRQQLLAPHRRDRIQAIEAAASHARDPVIYSALAQELLLRGTAGGVCQDFQLREAYASALGGASDIPFVRRALFQVLSRPDPNWEVRAAAIGALLAPLKGGVTIPHMAHLQALTPLILYRDANVEVQQALAKRLQALQLRPDSPSLPARQLERYISPLRPSCEAHRHILGLLADHQVEEAARVHEDAFELRRSHVLEGYPDDLYSDATLAAAVRSYSISASTVSRIQRVLLIPLEEAVEAAANGCASNNPDLLPALQFICDAELTGLRDDVQRTVKALILSRSPLARSASDTQADFELQIAEQQRLREITARKHACEMAAHGLAYRLRDTERPVDTLLEALQHMERAVAYRCMPIATVGRLGEALVQLIQHHPLAAVEFFEKHAPRLPSDLRAVCKVALSSFRSNDVWMESALAQLSPKASADESAATAFRGWAVQRSQQLENARSLRILRESVERAMAHLVGGVRSTSEPGNAARLALTCIENAIAARAALRDPRRDVARVLAVLWEYDRHHETKEFEGCCAWLLEGRSRALQELVLLALEGLQPIRERANVLRRFSAVQAALRTPPRSEHEP